MKNDINKVVKNSPADSKNKKEDLVKFNENPFDPNQKKPEDIARLFYQNDIPIIPVVSKRGILLGVLNKKDVVSELSDIERANKLSIDKLITKLAKKMTFEDLLPFGKIKKFTVINIFGEIIDNWSRIQLFSACENKNIPVNKNDEIDDQKDEKVMEWIIYMVLEQIPRPLYAINNKGKTIFYNSHFEMNYYNNFTSDVDTSIVEKLLANTSKNQIVTSTKGKDIKFLNKELNILYEKIPLKNGKKRVGFLIFCDLTDNIQFELSIPGTDLRNLSLNETLEAIERYIIVSEVKSSENIMEVAANLKLSRQSLTGKLKKFKIKH
jgi:hypothetical protein